MAIAAASVVLLAVAALGAGGPPPHVMGSALHAIAQYLPLTIVTNAVREPWLGLGTPTGLSAEPNAPPVLALTTFDDDHRLSGMLRAGAAGFVLKGIAAEELQRAVRVVADGGSGWTRS